MSINTSINPIVVDPERIRSISEIEDILSRIYTYEQKTENYAGVILLQNRQLGGINVIISEEEAKEKLRVPVSNNISEYGIVFWKRSYFEKLRKFYSNGHVTPLNDKEKKYLFKEHILYRD